MKTKLVLASFQTPHHGAIEIERIASGLFAVVGDYHPDDSKVVHYVGSAKQAWLTASTCVRGYGRNKLSLNHACKA